MAFCAPETIRIVKDALMGKPLGYILLTHTHYDHVGALPYFRREWPLAQVATCATGTSALLRSTPRAFISELSATAALLYGSEALDNYDAELLRADMIIKEGDAVELGGISVETLEAPGHTRDSICFYVPELELLMLNETPGVLMPDGGIYPCFLTGYGDTLKTIEKCAGIKSSFLSLPHRGIPGDCETDDFYNRAAAVNNECFEYIGGMIGAGASEAAMIDGLSEKYYYGALKKYQPRDAFIASAKAMIACTARELSRETARDTER